MYSKKWFTSLAPVFICLVGFFVSSLISPAVAYYDQDSQVNFIEYTNNVVARNKQENKPYFLLFAAEWCYWCAQFENRTLIRKDVTDFLNQNFVNVFIDTDIHNSAYVKYRATGLPYSVFLNPDGTLYYQYAGTLYADDFLDVIKEVRTEAGSGKYALGMESNYISYAPPSNLTDSDLIDMPDSFKQGVLDNFDSSEYGLGKGQKSILPRTFLYLLEKSDAAERDQALQSISKTLERAIDRIYDPIEGGFFRYAESRDWKSPRFEKFADINTSRLRFELLQPVTSCFG